jgi:hypothetical protein
VKNEVPKAAIVAIGVVLVFIIGLAAHKFLFGDPAAKTATPEQMDAAKQMRANVMAPGVHRDPATGHFIDAQGNPVNIAPTRKGQ